MNRKEKKEFEMTLSSVKQFEKPKINKEQYFTGIKNTVNIYCLIQENYDLEDKIIADLGAGTGILSIAGSYLGASHVVAFEIDQDAVSILNKNLEFFGIENIDVVLGDLRNINLKENSVDCVIMNPPFGAKLNKEVFLNFIEKAFFISDGPVFCVQLAWLEKKLCKIAEDFGRKFVVLDIFDYDIPKTEFDKKDMKKFKKKKNYSKKNNPKNYHTKENVKVELLIGMFELLTN